MDEEPILIVGAGPTGLTLAAQVRRFGLRPRLIDRLGDRAHESRALAIQPRSLEVLQRLGVAERLVERGEEAVELRLHARNRLVALQLFDLGLEDTEYPFLLFLSQAETEDVLRGHLAQRDVEVERGVELLGFEPEEGHVVCELQHADGRKEILRTPWLIGCDGAHSTVRRAGGIGFHGERYPHTFVLADLEVDGGLEPGHVHVFAGTAGMLFFFPLGRPASWRMQGVVPGAEVAERTGEPSLGDLQAIVDGFTGRDLRLQDPVWRTYFRVHRRQAERYRVGRVFLAGDAAHVHSPAGAQGMNTGIQDAWNLGWKLALVARGEAPPALLDSYEPERWPVGRSVLRLSDRPFRLATSDGWIFRWVRRHVLPRIAPMAVRFDAPRGFAFRRLAQLEVGYRDGPLAEEGQPRLRQGPRAGDRIPDAWLEREGRPTTLHRELSGPGLHLVLCGPERAWRDRPATSLQETYGSLLSVHHLTPSPSSGALADPGGQALARLGVADTAHYLVRPDDHIAYRAAGTDLGALARHLARWLA